MEVVLKSFLDSRDSGTIVMSHFSLLLGVSVPVWLGVQVGLAGINSLMVAQIEMST